MNLKSVSRSTQGELPVQVVAADTELVREIQGQLGVSGLLDPPVDGKFGAVSQWALTQFCEKVGLDFDVRRGLTNAIADALLGAKVHGLFPIDTGEKNALAVKLVMAMQRRGYWIAKHPKCVNIVYVEGMDPTGVPNDNLPNEFNDARFVLSIGEDGKPEIAAGYEATTEPGRYWTEHHIISDGAMRIAFGQYKAWCVGLHYPGSADSHEALVQVECVSVFRDKNRDYRREGDKLDTGLFALNQHSGHDLPKCDVGTEGSGCLVGRLKAGHHDFMARIKTDPRYQANRGYRFMTTVLPAAAISEVAFNPSFPH